MYAEHAPKPYGRAGLVVLALINIVAIAMIFGEISTISSWKTASADSYTIAEAAYLGSLWTKVATYCLMLLILDAFCIGVALCVRVSALHRAVNWAAIMGEKA